MSSHRKVAFLGKDTGQSRLCPFPFSFKRKDAFLFGKGQKGRRKASSLVTVISRFYEEGDGISVAL
jgi:hypothetical protein